MRQRSVGSKEAVDKLVKNIRRKTARRYSAEVDVSRFSAAPVSLYAAFASKAKGLFQPRAECRRRGL